MANPLIIFLDLDGVFKTARTILAGLEYDPVLSALLDKLFAQPMTFAVISATCRKHFAEDDAQGSQKFWRSLGMPNLKLHPDQWYSSRDTGERAWEISHWLEKHHKPHNSYLFIDDEFPKYVEGMLEEHHTIIRENWLLSSGQSGVLHSQCRQLFDLRKSREKNAR